MKIKHSEKKDIIQRLVIVPAKQKRPFWAKEMKFLNDFIDKYPDADFWKKVNFGKKLESLLLLKGESGEKSLKKKYLEYKYIIPEQEKYTIGKKSGKDTVVDPTPRTIKDFLADRFFRTK